MAVAAVVLVCILAIGPFQRETYAQIKTITYSVQEMLGMETDLSSYETLVGKTVAKDGVTITVNDVVVDCNEMVVSYTMTADNLENSTLRCALDVRVNGKSVNSGATGESWMADTDNMVSLDNLYLDDVDMEKENYYKIVFYVYHEREDDGPTNMFETKVGAVEFLATGEKLAAETRTVLLEETCAFPNGDEIYFTKFTCNAMGPKIYCGSKNGQLNYEVWLKGNDDLGNEMYFYLTHFEGDGESWFVLADDTGHMFYEDASSLKLQVYAAEYPEESGEIRSEYQEVGEPFTIELK